MLKWLSSFTGSVRVSNVPPLLAQNDALSARHRKKHARFHMPANN
jgi:hypothetical protein